MTAAKVVINEIIKATRVPSPAGVVGYMPIPLLRGRTDRAMFISNSSQFLDRLTPNGRVDVGMSLAHYSALNFLERSNGLWVSRVANNAKFAGFVFPAEISAIIPKKTTGLDKPSIYRFSEGELLLFYATSEGAWGNAIEVKLSPDPKSITPNTFLVEVYYQLELREQFLVSRVQGEKDGMQRDLYVETVLEQSNYLRVLDNVMIREDILPKFSAINTIKIDAPEEVQSFKDSESILSQIDTYTIEATNLTSGKIPIAFQGELVTVGQALTVEEFTDQLIVPDFLSSSTVLKSVTQDNNTINFEYLDSLGENNLSKPILGSDAISFFNLTQMTEAQTGISGAIWTFEVSSSSPDVELAVDIDGVSFKVGSSLTATEVATLIADESFALNSSISSVTSTGNLVTIEYVEAAGKVEPVISQTYQIELSRSLVYRDYIEESSGRKQEERIIVTAAPTTDGAISVFGINILVENSDPTQTVAAKIADALAAHPDLNTVVSGNEVKVTYAKAGQQLSIAYDVSSTGVELGFITEITGIDPIPLVDQINKFTVFQANLSGKTVLLNIEGVNVEIPSTATTKTLVAAAIVSQKSKLIDSGKFNDVYSVGQEVYFQSNGFGELRIFAGGASTPKINPVTTREYLSASIAIPEIQRLRVTAGNTSGDYEVIYVDGVGINVPPSDTTPEKVVARIKDVDLMQFNTRINSINILSSDRKSLDIQFKAESGNVGDIKYDLGNLVGSKILGGGDDGEVITDQNMVNSLTHLEKITPRVVMDGGWATVAFHKEIAVKANKKQDFVYILSMPYITEANSRYLSAMIDYRRNELNLNNDRGAIYAGQMKIQDAFNDRKFFMSPDGLIGGGLSANMNRREWWIPFAGNRRGQLTKPLDILRHFTLEEMDQLTDNQINPIWFDAGKGIKVWGQSTLSARPTPMDRLNVRLLLIYIEIGAKIYLDDFLFELNTEDTRKQIVTGLEFFMENIKTRYGVYDFLVVCNDTNNSAQDVQNYTLNVDLYVSPVLGIEQIKLNAIVTRYGVTLGA